MYTTLLVLLFIDAVVLVLAILLQSGKGGGLAASFGGMTSSSDALLGTRQAGNLLTKLSWWSGGLFLGIAYILSLMSAQARAPRSVLDQTFTPPPAGAPAAAAPVNKAPAGIPLSPAPATKTPPQGTAPATKQP